MVDVLHGVLPPPAVRLVRGATSDSNVDVLGRTRAVIVPGLKRETWGCKTHVICAETVKDHRLTLKVALFLSCSRVDLDLDLAPWWK